MGLLTPLTLIDFLAPYSGEIFWIALMCIPFWWLADVLGLWDRWQEAIEKWLKEL